MPVVVVGGGTVAARKVSLLLPCRPRLRLVAPELVPHLRAAATRGTITWEARSYRPGDLRGARLAIAATDDPATNRAVWREARRRRVWVNVADDPERSTFIVPAVLQRGEVTIAVATGGASPALARRVREAIAEVIGPEYGTLAMLLAELRPVVQRRYRDRAQREAVLRLLANADVLAALRAGDLAAARRLLARLAAVGADGVPAETDDGPPGVG